jgi:ethanolamine-phosphate cytidylyltransferase
LKKAKEMGDYLYVGLHDDSIVSQYRGKNYPILNLQERVMNILALKYVDDVVIAAPWSITEDLIRSLKISLVIQGSTKKFDDDYLSAVDPYEVPKKLGIYKQVESSSELTNEVLVNRLIARRENYMKKYLNKSKKETEYYQSKEYIDEI